MQMFEQLCDDSTTPQAKIAAVMAKEEFV